MTTVRDFWVDIERDGQRVGAGPIRVRSFRVTEALDGSGSFEMECAAAQPNIAALAEKTTVRCWFVDRHGAVREFGAGVVDEITYRLTEDGQIWLSVRGNDIGRELAYRSVGRLSLPGVLDAPARIMALAPSGWTLSGLTTTARAVYARFDGESVLTALVRVAELTGEHYRIGPGRTVEWLGAEMASSGYYGVQHAHDPVAVEDSPAVIIRALDATTSTSDLVSRVMPRGAGRGDGALTLAWASDTPPAGYTLDAANNTLINDATEAAYGRIERTLDVRDITPQDTDDASVQAASNALLWAAVAYLEQHASPVQTYRLDVGNASLDLRPGTLLPVRYRYLGDGRVLYNLDETYSILQVERMLTADAAATVRLEVGAARQRTDADAVAGGMMAAQTATTHAQPATTLGVYTSSSLVDSATPAEIRLWMGDYLTASAAALRFWVRAVDADPLTLADLTVTVNGTDRTADVTDIGGGWYALDLTADIISNRRPENATILISTSSTRTGRIEAQVTVRGTIQE